MGHLPRVGIYGETNQPKSEMYVTGSKAGQMQSCYHYEIEGPNQGHGDPGFNVCLAETGFVLIQYFSPMAMFLLFRIAVCILDHYMLEVCDLPFNFTVFYI